MTPHEFDARLGEARSSLLALKWEIAAGATIAPLSTTRLPSRDAQLCRIEARLANQHCQSLKHKLESLDTEGKLPTSIEWVKGSDLPAGTFPDP